MLLILYSGAPPYRPTRVIAVDQCYVKATKHVTKFLQPQAVFNTTYLIGDIWHQVSHCTRIEVLY